MITCWENFPAQQLCSLLDKHQMMLGYLKEKIMLRNINHYKQQVDLQKLILLNCFTWLETQITTYISFLKSKLLTMLLCTWSQQKLSLNPALDKVQQVWTRLYVDSGAAPEVYHRMSPQSTVKQVMDHVHCVHQVVLEISGCHVSSICKGLLEGETIVSYQWLITLSIIVLHLRFSMLQELQTHCHL